MDSSSFNGQLNTGEIVPQRFLTQERNFRVGSAQQQQQFRQRQLTSQFRQQTTTRFQPTSGQLRQQFSQQVLQQQQRTQFQRQEQQPEQVYGPPPTQQQQPQQPPTNQYGPPQPQYIPPATEQNNGSGDAETEYDDEESEAGPSVAVANAVNNGQYYILGQDNTLQRVVYMTSQTEDDKQNNGFTAQLRYAAVEPIRDPIYAYDAAGQLVRIYNRK